MEEVVLEDEDDRIKAKLDQREKAEEESRRIEEEVEEDEEEVN